MGSLNKYRSVNILRVHKVLFVILLILFSCSKQEPPKIASNELAARQNYDKESCQRVSFIKNLLEKSNFENVFKCTKWDKKFPNMFKALKVFPTLEWNHLFKVVDQKLLNDTKKRDKLFKIFKDLKSKNGFVDFDIVSRAFFSTHSLKQIKELFRCANDSSCTENHIEKKQLLEILRKTFPKQETIYRLKALLKNLSNNYSLNGDALSKNVDKLYISKDYAEKRLEFFKSLASWFENNPVDKDEYNFLISILLTKGEAGFWPIEFLNSDDIDKDKFEDIINFLITNKDLVYDLMALNSKKYISVTCPRYNDDSREIELNIKNTTDEILETILSEDKGTIIQSLDQKMNLLMMANEICPQIKNYNYIIKKPSPNGLISENHNINFLKFISKISNFSRTNSRLSLLKYSLHLGKNLNNEDGIKHIFKYVDRPYILTLFDLLEIIQDESLGIYKNQFDILKSLQNEDLRNLAFLLKIPLTDNNYLKNLSNLVLSLDDEVEKHIFKIVDLHFTSSVKTSILLSFYEEMLNEVAEVSDDFLKAYTLSESELDLTYKSIEKLSSIFLEDDVVDEMKVFFSSDHMLKIIDIIVNGVKLQNILTSDSNVAFVKPLNEEEDIARFVFKYGSHESEGKNLNDLKCLDTIANKGIELYSYVLRPQDDCKEVTEISSWLLNQMAKLNVDFAAFLNNKKYFKEEDFKKNDSSYNLFDRYGLFSSEFLNGLIANLIAFHQNLGDYYGVSSGITYLINAVKNHLFEFEYKNSKGEQFKGLSSIVNSLLDITSKIHQKNISNFNIYLNSLVDEITNSKKKKYDLFAPYLKTVGKIFVDYGEWIETDKGAMIEDQRNDLSCLQGMNQLIGSNPCPTSEALKKAMKPLVARSLKKFSTNSFLSEKIRSMHPDYGIQIPFDSKKQRKFQMTVKDLVKSVYEMSDKDYIAMRHGKRSYVNRLPVVYNNPGEDTKYYRTLTTLERVEISIRDIRFDNNYLGARYINSVARAENYAQIVNNNKSMLSLCVPFHFCGHGLNADERRLARNALRSYDGLLEGGSIFGYNDYLKALLGVVVRSSEKSSQEDSLIKFFLGTAIVDIPKILTEKSLKGHNGKILIDFSMLSGFSNLARFVRDRVGRKNSEFNEFLKSRSFNLINANFLRGYDLEKTQFVASNLLKAAFYYKDSDGILADQVIDWLYKLDYKEMRLIENTLYNLLILNSFLGSPKVLQTNSFNKTSKSYVEYFHNRYKANNILPLAEKFSYFMPYIFLIKKYFPKDIKLINIFKTINGPIRFLAESVVKENVLDRHSYYAFINESMLLINDLLLNKYSKISGFDIVQDILKNPSLNQDIQDLVRNISSYMESLHYENDKNKKTVTGLRFKELGQNLERVFSSKIVNFSALRKYFNLTTKEYICAEKDLLNCLKNPHFQEPLRLITFGQDKNFSQAKTTIDFLEELFVRRYEELKNFLLNILTSVSLVFKNP